MSVLACAFEVQWGSLYQSALVPCLILDALLVVLELLQLALEVVDVPLQVVRLAVGEAQLCRGPHGARHPAERASGHGSPSTPHDLAHAGPTKAYASSLGTPRS